MDRLNKEYIELLSREDNASDKFWKLEKRIKEDKRKPGVLIQLRKSEVDFDLVRLICDGVITADDLDGFSDDLRDTVLHLADSWMKDTDEVEA